MNRNSSTLKLPEARYEKISVYDRPGLALPGLVDRIRQGTALHAVGREPVGYCGVPGPARFHTHAGLAVACEGSSRVARTRIARGIGFVIASVANRVGGVFGVRLKIVDSVRSIGLDIASRIFGVGLNIGGSVFLRALIACGERRETGGEHERSGDLHEVSPELIKQAGAKRMTAVTVPSCQGFGRSINV